MQNFLRSKHVNNVCILLQLRPSDPLSGLRPWTPLKSPGCLGYNPPNENSWRRRSPACHCNSQACESWKSSADKQTLFETISVTEQSVRRRLLHLRVNTFASNCRMYCYITLSIKQNKTNVILRGLFGL